MKKKTTFLAMVLAAATAAFAFDPCDYVDPRIGSLGLGRVYVGPTVPYGMAKPSPDGVSMPNSGWAPMPEPIKGFSQTHVSGTGGGQKYGNILVMPFAGDADPLAGLQDVRTDETIGLCSYAATLQSGIDVDITSASRASIYRFAYPAGERAGLVVDAGAFLGMSPIPDQRETQQLVGSQIEVVSDHAVKGYNRVRGGWNNGRAYTVYFYAEADRPFASVETWKGGKMSSQPWQSDTHQPTGAKVAFAEGVDKVTFKVGISYISELKAMENLAAEIPDWDFDGVKEAGLAQWRELLSRAELAPSATEEQRRMFYTGIYHAMIMPVDRSGENPLWADDDTCYDDFYAIWDTYRTSTPMITILDPDREAAIVNSLLNIYKRDGYLPDARSGNSNGRTQGGSNAEIVIADAYVKGLQGIDYGLALEAMLKDADVPPGGNEEAEGRGGLVEYNTLGYVPFGIPRAGNRTVEYAYCDYAIAEVAEGLGRDDIRDRFMRQSGNWRNLWRDDYEHAGVKGFIMPRDRDGCWLDSLPQGHSALRQAKYPYDAMTFEGPWYTPWWGMFFYEAPSWEYSLSIPHDVPGLIEKCGGKEAFERRLDVFFDQGFYNVNNEPSFLSPCLYHWIGKPWRSSDRVREIVAEHFNDGPQGLPGNDDSGAMSSWLAFHMIGLYPNAGQSYYLINSPMVESATLRMPSGKDFTIRAAKLSDKNRYIQGAKLNGVDYPYSSLNHSDLAGGGELVLAMGPKPSQWGRELAPADPIPAWRPEEKAETVEIDLPSLYFIDHVGTANLLYVFKLHGQTRRYKMEFKYQDGGSMLLIWGIERNLKWQEGSFTIAREALEKGDMLSFQMPIDGEHVALPANETAYIISRQAMDALLKDGRMSYNCTEYELVGNSGEMLHVRDINEGAQMWILNNPMFPLVLAMRDNPLNVNWTAKALDK